MPKKSELLKQVTLDEFNAWLEKLTWLDLANFKILISMPNAVEVVSKLPEGEYRRMAIFGIAYVKVMEKTNDDPRRR